VGKKHQQNAALPQCGVLAPQLYETEGGEQLRRWAQRLRVGYSIKHLEAGILMNDHRPSFCRAIQGENNTARGQYAKNTPKASVFAPALRCFGLLRLAKIFTGACL
jgi:hypothetical protein